MKRTGGGEVRLGAAQRWWIYQAERFPLFKNAVLIFAFSAAAVAYTAALRGGQPPPAPAAFIGAFVNSFLAFLQLRIADEFKDAEEDARYRPSRPVPRGVVTLPELAGLFALSAVIQAAAALWLEPRLLPLLAVQWAYLALMTQEFFARDWLKARPFTYMWTHMAIMPLIDLYATACDWLPAKVKPGAGLGWFLTASFFTGMTIEIGRKLRAPADEELGVPTYSAIWGMRSACAAWLFAIAGSGACAFIAAWIATGLFWTILLPVGCWIAAAAISMRFLQCPVPRSGRIFETASGLWTLALYIWLGASIWL